LAAWRPRARSYTSAQVRAVRARGCAVCCCWLTKRHGRLQPPPMLLPHNVPATPRNTHPRLRVWSRSST
jgi:hypothetical protein